MNEIRKMLKQLANSLSANEALFSQVESELVLDDLSFFKATIILFTEKKEHDAINKIIKDIGIPNTLNFKDVCEGKINGTLSLANGVQCNLSFCHFDYYPSSITKDFNDIFKIIIYDEDYLSTYKKWELAKDIIGKNPAILVLVNISKNPSTNFEPTINSIHSFHYHSNEIEDSIFSILLQNQHIQSIQLARIQNYCSHVEQLRNLLNLEYESKFAEFNERAISVKNAYNQAKENLKKKSTNGITSLKVKINEETQKSLQIADANLRSFEKDSIELQKLREEIVSFEGFVEKKQNKSLEIEISKWALEDKSKKMIQLLEILCQDTVKNVEDCFAKLKLEIKETFQEANLGGINLPRFSFNQKQIREALEVIEISSDKSYERQIPRKGISALLMELRTPLFMLMPLMMVVGLFGGLVKSDDKGGIDESILFYENKPCIVITKLPESRNKQYLKFLNDIESLRSKEKGIFNKEIRGEMVMVPQLAVKEKIVKNSFKNKTVETLDYYFDKKNYLLYIFLKENSDRDFVVEQLFNPQNNLLSYPSSTRSSMGMGGLARGLSKLKDYRIIILIALSLLVCWFVVTRKKSMEEEFISLRAKEQNKLTTGLLQFIDKNAKQGTQKFNTILFQEIKEHQNKLLKKVEVTHSKKMLNEKNKREIYSKKTQQQLEKLRKEKMSYTNIKNNLKKVSLKISVFRGNILVSDKNK